MPVASSRWGARKNAWSRPWSWTQAAGHLATAYAIFCFAVFVQPAWQQTAHRGDILLLALFWVGFAVDLGLYLFVCLADTRYREEHQPSSGEYESRRCEECVDSITRLRVKHCQTCGKCTEDFDHHCRYLNVCVGGRTYIPWFFFVAGLLALMAVCGYTATDALATPDRYPLASRSSSAFYVVLGLQAAVSLVLSAFLLCLLAQHLYFIYEGITTLEYIKDQAAGFPALPPRGWREAVRKGRCYGCGDALELMEVDDGSEVWFCTVCQADVGKAGVEFHSCDRCDNVNVCPLCLRAASYSDTPIVTYRVSSLRRRAEVQAHRASGQACFRAGSYTHSRLSSFSGQREPRPSRRRAITAVVAAIEGHTGDTKVRRAICGGGEPEAEEYEEDDGESSGSSSDDSKGL